MIKWKLPTNKIHCFFTHTHTHIYIYVKAEQYWTSPGVNTPQDTNYTATCLPSRKLYKLDEPDTQDTAGEARTNSSVMYSYGPSHMAKQKQDDQFEHTYSSYVRLRDVTLKTCQKRWMIGRSGERGSGISVLEFRNEPEYFTSGTAQLFIPLMRFLLKNSVLRCFPALLRNFFLILSFISAYLMVSASNIPMYL